MRAPLSLFIVALAIVGGVAVANASPLSMGAQGLTPGDPGLLLTVQGKDIDNGPNKPPPPSNPSKCTGLKCSAKAKKVKS